MNHLGIYKELYKHVLAIISCIENEAFIKGGIKLGVLLQTLKYLIDTSCNGEECPECKKEAEEQKDDDDIEKVRTLISALEALKAGLNK